MARGSRGRASASRILASSSFRLALVYMSLLGTSVVVLLGFIYWSTAGYMVRQTDATILAEIGGLSERYRLTGVDGLVTLLEARIEREPAGGPVYLLTDARGRKLAGNLQRWPAGAASGDGWLQFRLEVPDREGSVEKPARAREFALRGGLRLLVGRDVNELRTHPPAYREHPDLGVGLTVILAIAGGWVMSRSTARRIEAINETGREIMSGDMARRVPINGSGDDFDQLAVNLNAMLDRIEQLMTDVRQVSDNIAHDLRSPLARLRHHLEALTLSSKGCPSSDQGELIAQSLAEADGLLDTFNALLRIARIESGERRAGFGTVALDTVVQDVAELYEPVAEARNQHLATGIEDVAPIEGDRDLLFQACANLVDNAIKHSPPGARIEITLRAIPGGASVAVRDSGPGILPEDRERVLERFVRLDPSRSLPGNGLGLSLVQAVARLHHGRLELTGDGAGLTARIELPVSSDEFAAASLGDPPRVGRPSYSPTVNRMTGRVCEGIDLLDSFSRERRSG